MALSESTLSTLMRVTFGIFNDGTKDEYDSYAEGVINGLKLGTVQVITTGKSGQPGDGQFIGALQGGPLVMAPIVAINALGIMPPIPEGAPAPLLALWYLSIAQIATHALTSLEVTTIKSDAVSIGVGIVPPGGFSVSGSLIKAQIVLAYLKRGLVVTPRRLDVAGVIGSSTEQIMLTATMIIPIIGGVPAPEPTAIVGTRIGTIS